MIEKKLIPNFDDLVFLNLKGKSSEFLAVLS